MGVAKHYVADTRVAPDHQAATIQLRARQLERLSAIFRNEGDITDGVSPWTLRRLARWPRRGRRRSPLLNSNTPQYCRGATRLPSGPCLRQGWTRAPKSGQGSSEAQPEGKTPSSGRYTCSIQRRENSLPCRRGWRNRRRRLCFSALEGAANRRDPLHRIASPSRCRSIESVWRSTVLLADITKQTIQRTCGSAEVRQSFTAAHRAICERNLGDDHLQTIEIKASLRKVEVTAFTCPEATDKVQHDGDHAQQNCVHGAHQAPPAAHRAAW